MVSTRARVRAETTRELIPGSRSKVQCDVVYMLCLNKSSEISFWRHIRNKCIFRNFKKSIYSYACTHTCKSCRTLLTKFGHLIVIIGNVLNVILDLLNVLTPLQIPMHLSGSLLLLVKNYSVLFFETSHESRIKVA